MSLIGQDRAEAAKSYLRRSAELATWFKALDVATMLAGIWLVLACLSGRPGWGLTPFALCLVASALATRYQRRYIQLAHQATLEYQTQNPHVDDGCDCGSI
ncbi:MAG TPA: hypothetical protein VGO93_21275 [Candidatus Xenobia bacterium]|jgi:hypothetical protein